MWGRHFSGRQAVLGPVWLAWFLVRSFFLSRYNFLLCEIGNWKLGFMPVGNMDERSRFPYAMYTFLFICIFQSLSSRWTNTQIFLIVIGQLLAFEIVVSIDSCINLWFSYDHSLMTRRGAWSIFPNWTLYWMDIKMVEKSSWRFS